MAAPRPPPAAPARPARATWALLATLCGRVAAYMDGSCSPIPSWNIPPPDWEGEEPPPPCVEPAAQEEPPLHGRRLQRIYEGGPPFFDDAKPPYVNVLVHDSHGPECDLNYTTPVTDMGAAGYPADGTSAYRKREMSCGVTIARFVFFTADKSDYTNPNYTAKMQVKIDCALSKFIESDTCENLLDATSTDPTGFPRLSGCRFLGNEARLILSTRLKPNQRYDITFKMLNPNGKYTASENSFHLTTEYYQLKVIEGTKSPIDMTYTTYNTKNWEHLSPAQYKFDWERQRGYITAFTWKPLTGEWFPDSGYQSNRFQFEIQTWGLMTGTGSSSGMYYKIRFIAYPTNLWKFCLNGFCRQPRDSCDWSPGPALSSAVCDYDSYQGASATEVNGFEITLRGTPLENVKEVFTIKADNPKRGVNLYWTATSYRYDAGGTMYEPYTILLNSPVSVLGEASGKVAAWEISATNQEQWLQVEFKPGNTLMGSLEEIAGILVIIPPDNFEVIASAQPQVPDEGYNALPCAQWPSADREAAVMPRFVCTVGDEALLSTTTYRVKLRVKNPVTMGAARSWRVETWQFFSAGGWVGGSLRANKPISVTRSLLGMPVSGTMIASIAPQNQLLGGQNKLRFEFTPSNDIGGQPYTRLKVVAPKGFLIVKRCIGFNRDPPMVLPLCTCAGSDSNSFDLIFTYGDAIKGGVRYIFELTLTNPSVNVAQAVNIWQFDTVRPDGVPRDTARYPGFFLFPVEMARFQVVPVTREIGPNPVIVRFISQTRIPFDDFLTIRAPATVEWYDTDLQFSSMNKDTNATTVGTAHPTVNPLQKNILLVQLTTAMEANIEYGFKARCVIPGVTPVPNRWWIEQQRQTGLAPPNNWRYLASTGAEGFKSLVLINAVVEPFNVVEEGWENPTLITFEATQPVLPTTKVTPSGIVNVSAELLVVAPPGFTFICPLSPTVYLPEFAVPVPSNVVCVIDHNNQLIRNQLSLFFPDGIKAETRYALTIDVVNAKLSELDLSKNKFRLATRLDAVEVEAVNVPGYLLAKRMDNTRFWNLPYRQNFFPELPKNEVTWYIGTTEAINVDTILEVKAPRGFAFADVCTQDVSYPGGPLGLAGVIQLPTIVLCQSLAYQDITKTYIAHIVMTGKWLLGTTAISVKVTNPMRTPEINFWGFTIMTRSFVPLQSEARVYGFEIAVVIDPQIVPAIIGNGVSREAAINTLEVSFSLTTFIPGVATRGNQIVLTAPRGFRFTPVCRFFSPSTGKSQYADLHEDTICAGNNASQLLLTLPLLRSLENRTRYAFRISVINPDQTFTEVNVPDKWWAISTRTTPVDYVDSTRDIPSFPVVHRVSFIQVDTLSAVGLNSTTYRFLFRTAAPLPPKQTLTISPPAGFKFGGLSNQQCINVDPMIIKRQFDNDFGMKALIAGVTRLPEWMVCRVDRVKNVVTLTNEEPLLGGRPLINGPVFEFFVMNSTNAEATPAPGLNLFTVEAKTLVEYGVEMFAGEGWTIYPELLLTQVSTSNPGYGLYTNFTFTLQTVTRVPGGGSIRIVSPKDYYFGPLIETPATKYDPLVSAPPPQGAMLLPRPTGPVEGCGLLRPPGWICPFELTPCMDRDKLDELRSIGYTLTVDQLSTRTIASVNCNTMTDACATKRLSDLITCESNASELILNLKPGVVLPARRVLKVLVQGYNLRDSMAPTVSTALGEQICVDCWLNTWAMQTRDDSTEKLELDKKAGIPGLKLYGIVSVLSIKPSDTKVNSIENYVTVTIRLAVPCDPRGTLRITHPIEYMKNANAAFQGAPVTTGPTFPRLKEIRQSLNTIEIIALEERIPADTDIEIGIIMSNPSISPPRPVNIWTFEALSSRTGENLLLNVNYNVSGFKIFGEFSRAAVTATVLSPLSASIIGVWFVLKSALERVPFEISKGMRIWLPKGFTPNPTPKPPVYAPLNCNDFSFTYNPNREGVAGFPSTIKYIELPSGSYCKTNWDESYQQYYVGISIDGPQLVDSGWDYGFEFGVINPAVEGQPPPEENLWRVETVMQNVILHLKTGIPGYELEQIKVVQLTYEDTTKRRTLNPIEFYLMSEKFIPGGSKIIIRGPDGFQVGCVFFRPVLGLSSTTTCLVRQSNIVEFTLDSQDPKNVNTPMAIRVMWTNPEFTPQNNWWRVDIMSPLKKAIDVRDYIHGFDITDRAEVYVKPTFAYLGELNPVLVYFLAYTIMNQADTGNELVLVAPGGYIFPETCTSFHLRLTDSSQANQATTSATGYDTGFVFPPPGTQCIAFDNATVIIRLPTGAGLLKNNYTLEVAVQNPGYRPNGTNIWQFYTRVRNENGTKYVDANRSLAGFTLDELVPLRTDEGAAPRSALPAALPALLLLLSFPWRVALGALGGSDADGRAAS